MDFNHPDLLEPNTPLIFADGTKVYEKLAKDYVRHNVGYFVLAPSGAGKTHYVKSQSEKHWMDGDILWETCNAHPRGKWWLEDIERINEIDQQSDIITAQAKKLGFWVMGTSNYWLTPDAMIIPDWEVHKGYIAKREATNYDGGATTKELDGVLWHREWMLKRYGNKIPQFTSVPEAADYLDGLAKKA